MRLLQSRRLALSSSHASADGPAVAEHDIKRKNRWWNGERRYDGLRMRCGQFVIQGNERTLESCAHIMHVALQGHLEGLRAGWGGGG